MLTLYITPLLVLSIGPLYKTRLRIPVLVAVTLLLLFAVVYTVHTSLRAMEALFGVLT